MRCHLQEAAGDAGAMPGLRNGHLRVVSCSHGRQLIISNPYSTFILGLLANCVMVGQCQHSGEMQQELEP